MMYLYDIKLIHPRTALCEPLHPSGFLGNTGFYLEFNERLYPDKVRVLATNQCREVKPGDVVKVPALSWDTYTLQDGRTVYAIKEEVMLAVIEGFDDEVQYVPVEETNVH
jgi:hypothetical protein